MNKKTLQSIFLISICIILLITSFFILTHESSNTKRQGLSDEDIIDENIDFSLGEVGGYLCANTMMINNLNSEMRFYANNSGHGFAAERANNLIDRLLGNEAVIVGDNNLKNGADRIISRRGGSEQTFIQDKYYNSASHTVDACFDENGIFRYFDNQNRPMQIEVPADQYEEAVALMEERIRTGNVPGVTDPSEAQNIIRKGRITYQQAVNITKAGNIDSILYDAANGCVYATCAAGISFAIDFVICKINGQSNADALKNSTVNGLKTGAVVGITYILTSQLAKAGAANAFVPAANALYKFLGENVARNVLAANGIATQTGISAADMTATQLETEFAKTISNKLLTDGVLVVVLMTPDVIDLFRGRISAEHLLGDLVVAVASVAGAEVGSVAGGTLGSLIAPGIGTAVGSFVGGVAGGVGAGFAANWLMEDTLKKDADEMFAIITDAFTNLADEYLVTQNEADQIVTELQNSLTEDLIKDMYASENRDAFARDFMEPLFVSEIQLREEIYIPSEMDLRSELEQELAGLLFIH